MKSRSTSARAKTIRTKADGDGIDPIRHVVLLMLENRSFDQMLGMLQAENAAINGVPPGPPTRFNAGPSPGETYAQRSGALSVMNPDPPHEYINVVEQIDEDNGRFVKSFARAHPDSTPAQRQQVMACFAPGDLPALHSLARHFVVCDRWHAAVPGPTWTNRLFAMSGTSLGRVKMPEGIFDPNVHRYEQPSVFRRLAEAKRSYRIYFDDFPLSLLLEDQRRVSAGAHFAQHSKFFDDAKGPEPNFPEFAFVEPAYLWPRANDDHPPHDVSRGQALIAEVYEALRANEAVWQSTLLVITYDEHGGFYDHVVPLERGAVPPDDSHGEFQFRFDRTGVRVPALLVSPWLNPGVCSTALDHTSLLRFLQLKWGLGDLGRRVAAAASPFETLKLRSRSSDDAPMRLTLPAKTRSIAKKAPTAAPPLSDNQHAIIAFSEYLATKTRGALSAKAAATSRKLRGPAAASQVASDRAIRFLRQRGARLR